MQTKRIIPCLDVKDGRVVKGIKFENLTDIGDPSLCAMEYERQGADELVFLDITATVEGRKTMIENVRKTAASISIPLSVGGGISELDDFDRLFSAGASKVSINSAAVRDPDLIKNAAKEFGKDRVIVAIDYRLSESDYRQYWQVLISGGNIATGRDAIDWAKECESLGAGELLITSKDADGMKQGFDTGMLNAASEAVSIPVIASGGGGSPADFVEVFNKTSVDAALAASIFHYGSYDVKTIKDALKAEGIPVK